MSLIPDPEKPHGPAIDASTGDLAPAVHFIPRDAFADPNHPTMAELDAAIADGSHHIGWATRATSIDGSDLGKFTINPSGNDDEPPVATS